MDEIIKRMAIDVSNNSPLTKTVTANLLDKLDKTEKQGFLNWLKLIQTKQTILTNQSKYGKYLK